MFIGKFIGLKIQASVVLLVFLALSVCLAQRPQDNWYLEQTWTKTMAATNGGLSAPYGVAIGPDQRIYVGDQGLGSVQVYLPDGTFSFAITNTFGGGQSFSQPRGMITDKDGNLYVADYARNAVFVFTANGVFIRKIGGVTGSGDGQMSGVNDVGVSDEGEVFVLEKGNCRVSVFNNQGTFLRKWGYYGTLEGLLYVPCSLAVGKDRRVYIGTINETWSESYCHIKAFSLNGVLVRYWASVNQDSGSCIINSPSSVRVDKSGLICACLGATFIHQGYGGTSQNPCLIMYSSEGSGIAGTYRVPFYDPGSGAVQRYPFHAIGPDGTVVIVYRTGRQLFVYRQVFREQEVPPRNAIPLPTIIAIQQRPSSPLVDIDYQVTDVDDATVQTAMLVFTNSTATLKGCVRPSTLVEGTATNLGPNIAANVPHRVTWDAGADWPIDLGSYRVAVLAKDSRPNLLDIHYLRLKDEQGQPKMTISRSPLIQNDFMQVWWWLLANNDSAISLTSGRVYGVESPYAGSILCSNEVTTADGRAFVYGRMNVREATAAELTWARAAATTNSVEVWTPSKTVGGRPKAVNEYGFDTGSWGASAWWVVAE